MTSWNAWLEEDRAAEIVTDAMFAETAAELCAARYMHPDTATIRVCVIDVASPVQAVAVFEVSRAWVYTVRAK